MNKMDVPTKIVEVDAILAKMTNNAYYPNPRPSLAELSTALEACRFTHQEALTRGTEKVAIAALRLKDMDVMVSQLAAYVQSESNGEEVRILSSGFKVRSAATPTKPMTQPQALRFKLSPYPGQVDLKWEPVPGARTYFVEKSVDGANDWQQCGTCTRSSIHIAGFASTIYMWFRVSAIGGLGTSPASDAVKALIG